MVGFSVIRASVPKLNLDDVFEQKNEIAKAVEDELEKVMKLQLARACGCLGSVPSLPYTKKEKENIN